MNTIEKMSVGELGINNDEVKIQGATIAAMTVSPETTAEDGYITVDIAGTSYQIPVYAA